MQRPMLTLRQGVLGSRVHDIQRQSCANRHGQYGNNTIRENGFGLGMYNRFPPPLCVRRVMLHDEGKSPPYSNQPIGQSALEGL